eukprot:jgi/Psemu1/12349/gm1.12349_g
MSMTSLLAQEEGRSSVKAAAVPHMEREATSNTATQHFYHPELALLHVTYFKLQKKDKDERGEEEVFQVRNNKLNKGHLCLRWHSATKAFTELTICRYIFTACHNNKLPPNYKDGSHFQQDRFMGIYNQLMARHCPSWVDEELTYMEESALSPTIQLAQSWESPRHDTILRFDLQSGSGICLDGWISPPFDVDSPPTSFPSNSQSTQLQQKNHFNLQ